MDMEETARQAMVKQVILESPRDLLEDRDVVGKSKTTEIKENIILLDNLCGYY